MLTQKEKDILQALAAGKTQQEISYLNGWHLSTVEKILADLRLRYDCDTTLQLCVKLAVEECEKKLVAVTETRKEISGG